MNNTVIKNNAIGLLAAVITSLTIASCGGGGSSAPLPVDNGNGVAAGTTNVNGTVLQSTDVKASSAVGDGLAGLLVSLINTSTGSLMGTDVTDSLGKYEFKGIPSGDGYLVKIEFKSTQDLDGDGRLDEIELYFPVDLANQAVTELLQQIGVSDSDNDGQLDAIEVEFHLNDDHGNSESSHRQHRRRGGETRVDDNNDGSFDDSFDDSDGDGLPDTSFSGGSIDDSNSGLHELEVKGLIESISAENITVGGTSFAISSGTTWRIGDNRNADPALFTSGTFVEVEGFSDGNGGWIASKVKTEDDFSGIGSGNGGDDNGTGIDELEVKGLIEAIGEGTITVAGQEFSVSGETVWRIGDNRNADPALFAVGMFVEITGDLSGDSWHARRVKLEDSGISGGNGGDDDNSGDDNGGDDIGDDNGGNGNDDGAGDDNGGDDIGDDNGGNGDDDSAGDDNGGDDDNSGKGGGDDDEGDDDNSGKGGGDDK
ncbi:hypothetical protein KDL44_04725 [bacterium]|nr:hypothetical protein [bacterium]